MLGLSVFCVCLLSSVANGANILGVFMTPSHSHQIVFQPIWKELSLRGHKVTVYTPSPLKDPSLTNLTEYDLSFSFEYFKSVETAGQDYQKMFEFYVKASEAQLNHPYLQDLIKNTNNQSYDLVLVEYLWQPYYAFKEIYKAPIVGITSLPLTLQGAEALGMDKHPVLDPDLMLPFSQAESFRDRVLSWAFKWICKLKSLTTISPIMDAQISRYFGKDMKSTAQLRSEINLVLGNYNFALQNSKPMTPNFIPISGIHVQSLKPLPQEFESLLSNTTNDVIYFSFGTNVNPSTVSKDGMSKIFHVLGRLPYTVLFKYPKDDLPDNLPKNFIVKKWFPQQDILGHPKVKLFISQGGIQSMDEAISRKVPMLIFPFLGDQKSNADRCVRLGIAETLTFENFSEEELNQKINKIMKTSTYRKNIEKVSLIANDRPLSPIDTAMYWIEYVLRHNGAPHLKYGAAKIPFYQYYLLDVYLFVTFIVGLLYYICKKISKIIVLTYRVTFNLLVTRIVLWLNPKEKSH